MGLIHEEYERAFYRETKRGSWGYRVPGFDWLAPWQESRANRLAFIIAECFEKDAYREGDDDIRRDDVHLLWVHSQRCAIAAIRVKEYADAILFAGKALLLAKISNEDEPTTQFIWLLANRKDAEAEAMIRTFRPRSRERRQLEAAYAASKEH